ncbi:MAG TPA: tRNA (guanosine(37)-N1)-methyltransferase TrmD [Patescibacteria group bacterium]
MKINILTLFPEYFETPLATSILKRAQASGLVTFNVINIRDYATDKHQVTDDRPYGGGAGMVMKVEPIYAALQSLGVSKAQSNSKILLTSAKGKLFNQQKAQEYSQLQELTIICGHYEGVDERVADHLIDEEIRIGDYVLTGGEPAAAVIVDAVSRLIPGVLGNEESNLNESHSEPGVLGYPVYTRPEEFNGWTIPEVLLTGDHKMIEEWREKQKKKDL